MTGFTNTRRIEDERQRIRDAARRLLDNAAERSNGTYTVAALAVESGVPRHRLYEQHSELIDEFRTSAGRGPVTPNIRSLQQQLADAHERNRELIADNELLRRKTRTLAAVITELTHEVSGRDVVITMPRSRRAQPGR